MPQDKSIFEIGSAFGRDANFMESLGYKVNRSDAASSFVNYLHEQGSSCQLFNALKDDLSDSTFAVFASAVFLHFTKHELENVLKRMYAKFDDGGLLAFSVKCGIGQEWENEKLGRKRLFCYWQPNELQNLLSKFNFEILYLEQDEEQKWIYIIAKKNNL
jgi:hypothetical protein